MTSFGFPYLGLFVLLVLVEKGFSYTQQLCSVFQPFKVTPENAKFQIGGPFPLHTDDCVHVRPDIVQELIAVQWALSHWNQNPQNANYKLAMSAADTCSRQTEGLSQTVTFLNEAGFFLPKECYASDNPKLRTPLGLIMPMMESRRLNSLKDLISAVQLPLITYSTSTAQALFDARINTAFSTVATIDHYIQAITIILNQLKTNHVTLIYSDKHVTKVTLEKELATLIKSNIIVTEQLSLDETSNPKLTRDGSSDVVVMMVSKDEFLDFTSSSKISATASRKLFITVPINGESWSRSEIQEFLLYKPIEARLLILQQSIIFESDQFRTYFLDILRNNYQSYALLATYMQQMYNCSLIGTDGLIDCGQIDPYELADGFVYNRAIESAVLATYAFGALTKAMASDPDEPCSKPGPTCARAATSFLKNRLTYTFGESDPQAYRGFTIKFGDDRTLESLRIEGLYARHDSEFQIDAIMNFSTNGEWKLETDSIKWTDGNRVASWCQPWRAECQNQICDSSEQRYESDRMWLQKPAHLYLMGLFDMRQYDSMNGRCNDTIENALNVAMPASFVYVLETIRQKYPEFNLLPDVELGGILIDTCQDSVIAIESILAASKDRKCLRVAETKDINATISSSNIIAFASGQNDRQYETIRFLFNGDKKGIRKPLIASSGLGKTINSGDTNLMPDYESQARIILDLLLSRGWDYVSILLSEHDPECLRAFEAFRRLVESDDRICISDIVKANRDRQIESIKIVNSPATRVAVSFTTANDTVMFLKSKSAYGQDLVDDRPVYIFIGQAHDWESVENTKPQIGLLPKSNAAAWGAVSIQPQRTVDQDFRTFLSTINPKRLPERWFIRFWEDYFQCAVRADQLIKHKRPCTGDEHLPIEMFGRLTREAYFMIGLEHTIFTLDAIYKKACPEQKGLCEAFFDDDFNEKLTHLVAQAPKLDRFVIYNYRPRANGGVYVEIGNGSMSEGLKFGDSWLWYDREGKSNLSLPESNCRPPLCRCKLENDFFNKPVDHPSDDDDQSINEDRLTHRSLSNVLRPSIRKTQSTGGFDYTSFSIRKELWKNQSWTYIFLVVNTLLLLSAVLVLGLVCLKLCFKVVKGNQSLGICLLIGVILLYTSVYFFIFDSCELLCRLRYIFHSLAYSICFGVMIAKAVQLRNSETLGFNGYVSYWNYWLLLFFIIIVQLALNTQWSLIREPITISFLVEGQSNTPSILIHCSWTSEEFLASQIYVVILLSMALFLSLMNRNVKRNYKETRWLMYTSLICAPIWILWMIGYALIPEPFKDTVVVMQLITCATVILCFMFGPKLYILLSYEPVLIEYPPGFKLNLGNGHLGATNLEKNNFETTNNYMQNQNQNQHDFGLHFGDIDDLQEDGQRSVVSASSGSTKSTSLSHTSSSASSMTTTSENSLTPVYQAVIRKKSRSKKMKAEQLASTSTIGSISPEVAQRREMIFGETISSVH